MSVYVKTYIDDINANGEERIWNQIKNDKLNYIYNMSIEPWNHILDSKFAFDYEEEEINLRSKQPIIFKDLPYHKLSEKTENVLITIYGYFDDEIETEKKEVEEI